MAWADLNTRERAAIIRLAVSQGYNNLDKIKENLNIFDDGGSKGKTKYESFPDLLKRLGLDNKIKITSGYRLPGAAGKAGSRSNHTRRNEHGDSYAYDIVPINGDFNDLELTMRLSPELMNYLIGNGYRLLKETDPETMKKTGATGLHWHLSYRPNSTEGLDITVIKGPDGLQKMVFNTLQLALIQIPALTLNLLILQSLELSLDILPIEILDLSKEDTNLGGQILDEVVVTAPRLYRDLPEDIKSYSPLLLVDNLTNDYNIPLESAINIVDNISNDYNKIELQSIEDRVLLSLKDEAITNSTLQYALSDRDRQNLINQIEYNRIKRNLSALGGVINQDNPILNYSVVKEDIPSVRYDYGGDKDNSFTEAAWDVAKILDPTGILSWKDAYRATKDFVSNPSWGGAGKAAIEIAGALPVVGKAGKALKIGTKVAKYGEAATKVGKAIDTAANIGKVPGKIVLKTTVKPIITSTINTTKKGVDKTKQIAKLLATEDDAVGLVLKPSVIDKAASTRTANDIMGVGTMAARAITKGTDLDYNLTNGIVTKPLFSSVLGNTGGSYNPIVAGLGTVARTWTDDNSYNGSYLYGYPDKESNRYSGNNRGDINILGLYIYGHPNLLFLYDILPVDTMYIPQSMANTLEIGKGTLYNTDHMDLNLGYPSRTLIDAKHFTGQWDKSGDTGLQFTATDKFDLKGTTGIFGDIVEDIITNDANAGAVNFKLTIPVVTVSDDDSRGLKTVKLLNSITEKANGGIINNTIPNTIYSGHIGMSRL